MSSTLDDFPISGAAVGTVLSAAARPDDLWIMTDIETLTDQPAMLLGELWKKTRDAPVIINTCDLCAALNFATQVVSLDVRLESAPSIRLTIEDGLAVEIAENNRGE